ncbi:MAG: ABC transporter substrate-binding protein [Bacteroidales bacterium]|nr:ABC transporter substrate-binding protein [Bacteroidales bacterium]
MKHFFLHISALLLFTLVACQGGNNTQSTTTSFIDDYGRTVQVPSSPTRIVSVSPAATEIIFALGGEQLLVGRTDFCNYPPEASSIESIGGITNLNIEKVASLKPDLIITASMVSEQTVSTLQKLGIPVVSVLEKEHLEDLYANIERIGQLIGKPQAADSLNQALQQQMGNLHKPTADPVPSIYYVIGFGSGGNYTAGGNTFINELLTYAGARNIAADIQGWNYSLEALMAADPDYVIVRQEDSASFCQTRPYNNLTAVKQGQVIALPAGLLDLQAPRNIKAIQIISKAIK